MTNTYPNMAADADASVACSHNSILYPYRLFYF